MQALTQGIHHLGLTVPDVKRSVRFFCDQLGFSVVGEKPDYPAAFVSDGTVMLTLWQTQPDRDATPFDRHHNIGLHHFALKVASKAALANLHQQLDQCPEVEIEFAPEPLGQSGITHMMCLIPGGIRMEFFAAA